MSLPALTTRAMATLRYTYSDDGTDETVPLWPTVAPWTSTRMFEPNADGIYIVECLNQHLGQLRPFHNAWASSITLGGSTTLRPGETVRVLTAVTGNGTFTYKLATNSKLIIPAIGENAAGVQIGGGYNLELAVGRVSTFTFTNNGPYTS